MRLLLLVVLSNLLLACSGGDSSEFASNKNDSLSARISLGKQLFFDVRLSRDMSLSCASCHKPALAMSDSVAKSKGFGGRSFLRNSPSLLNAGLHPYFFADGGAPSLELQALQPIEDENEMNMPLYQLAYRLRHEQEYEPLFKKAFGIAVDEFGITHALAAYVRSLSSGGSVYDTFLDDGDSTHLSASAKSGLNLFFGKANCGGCHSGKWLSDFKFYDVGTGSKDDVGRERITLRVQDRNKFKTPILRNLSVTGPYMHDGSISSLPGIVNHFDRLQNLKLSETQKVELVSFLESLTDTIYLNGRKFAGE